MSNELIGQFLDDDALKAMETIKTSADIKKIISASEKIAAIFGNSSDFKNATKDKSNGESKLVNSFKNNLQLLVQKTWVEKNDVELKEQALYQLTQFCQSFSQKIYAGTYKQFLEILNNVVFLMFGTQSRTPEFEEYALRIDPEFGIFWWYIKNLPTETDWSDEKCRAVILLGMFFLANY